MKLDALSLVATFPRFNERIHVFSVNALRRTTMPQPAAYTAAEVIATGLALQKTGPVSCEALHAALGGRGLRATAAGVWRDFEEMHNKLVPPAVPEAAEDLPPEAGQALTLMIETFVASVRKLQSDAAAVADRRVGHYVHQIDTLLSQRDSLHRDVEALTKRLDDTDRDVAQKDGTIAELREEVGQLRLQTALANARR